MEAIGMIQPTSKAALKAQSLYLANLDVDKAEKMYDFLIKDMSGIPDVEPASKSFMQNFGEQANGIFQWFKENEETIGKGVNFFKGIIARKNGEQAEPLPTINE